MNRGKPAEKIRQIMLTVKSVLELTGITMDDTNPNYHWCSDVSNTPAESTIERDTLYTASMVAQRVAHAKKEERETVMTEVIKIVSAYERKPKYDYEATLCSVIVESLESLRTDKEDP